MSSNHCDNNELVRSADQCLKKHVMLLIGVMAAIVCIAAAPPPPPPYTRWTCHDKVDRGDCVSGTCDCQQGPQVFKCCALWDYNAYPPCKRCSGSVNSFDPTCVPNPNGRTVPANVKLCPCINEDIHGSDVIRCTCDPDNCDDPVQGSKVCNC